MSTYQPDHIVAHKQLIEAKKNIFDYSYEVSIDRYFSLSQLRAYLQQRLGEENGDLINIANEYLADEKLSKRRDILFYLASEASTDNLKRKYQLVVDIDTIIETIFPELEENLGLTVNFLNPKDLKSRYKGAHSCCPNGPGGLKAVEKYIERLNKKQKTADYYEEQKMIARLNRESQVSEQLTLVNDGIDNNKLAFLFVDLEWYEHSKAGQEIVLEVGWTWFIPHFSSVFSNGTIEECMPEPLGRQYNWQSKNRLAEWGETEEEEDVVTRHCIIMENRKWRNGRHVIDNRDQFCFGFSNIASASDLKDWFEREIEFVKNLGRTILVVGQAPHTDIKLLSKFGINLQEYMILDTLILFNVMNRDNSGSSVQKMLEFFNIKPKFLHNAGNDAYFTMRVFRELAIAGFKKSFEVPNDLASKCPQIKE